MSYIGKSPSVGNFVKLDALTASATATYTMQVGSVNFEPESVNHMIVSLNGVIQAPTTSFTISGSTLTFASTLASSDSIDFIMVYGNVLDIGTPSDSTVSLAKLTATGSASSSTFLRGDNSWAAAGFDVSSITGATALAEQPASTDEIVLSDAGALKRLDIKHIQNTPAIFVYLGSNQANSDNTWTKIAFNTEDLDTDGTYDNSSNYRFTPAVAGKYLCYTQASTFGGQTTINYTQVAIYKNGSSHIQFYEDHQASRPYGDLVGGICVIDLDADDYLEVFSRTQLSTGSPTVQGNSGRVTYFGAMRITGV